MQALLVLPIFLYNSRASKTTLHAYVNPDEDLLLLSMGLRNCHVPRVAWLRLETPPMPSRA
eukprot:6900065-Prorocentrum_lima.AAC.1